MIRVCPIKHYFVDLDDYGCMMRQYDGCDEGCGRCPFDALYEDKRWDLKMRLGGFVK